MHPTWNPWPQLGSTRISSPTTNSVKQMAQSDNSPASSAVYTTFGSELKTSFFRALFLGELVVWAEIRHSQAQRATATRPRTHIRVQSRIVKISIRSELTLPMFVEFSTGAIEELITSTSILERRLFMIDVENWFQSEVSLELKVERSG